MKKVIIATAAVAVLTSAHIEAATPVVNSAPAATLTTTQLAQNNCAASNPCASMHDTPCSAVNCSPCGTSDCSPCAVSPCAADNPCAAANPCAGSTCNPCAAD